MKVNILHGLEVPDFAFSSCCICQTFHLAPFLLLENIQPRLASSKQAILGIIVNQFRKDKLPLRIKTTCNEKCNPVKYK